MRSVDLGTEDADGDLMVECMRLLEGDVNATTLTLDSDTQSNAIVETKVEKALMLSMLCLPSVVEQGLLLVCRHRHGAHWFGSRIWSQSET